MMTHRSTMGGAVAAFCLIFSVIMARADLMKDSPVTFPEKGALPSKYPPDVQTERSPSESDYSLFASPCRSPEQIDRIQAEMVKGEFTPPPTDWACLPRTRRVLTEGGDLHVLGLGDSIVNDTMRSGWLAKLQQAYPKAKIKGTVFVRGGGGCQHYREEDRIAKYVVPLKPDLVFIGGISQRSVDDIREVIHQLRAGLPDVEILLANGTFGSEDPRHPDALDKIQDPAGYTQLLKKLAAEERCALLDMRTPWIEYLLSAKVHPHLFYRDRVHANEFGEQILTKILLSFFRPESASSAVGARAWPAPMDVPEAIADVNSPAPRCALLDHAGLAGQGRKGRCADPCERRDGLVGLAAASRSGQPLGNGARVRQEPPAPGGSRPAAGAGGRRRKTADPELERVQRVRLVRSEHCVHWLLMSLTRGAANNEIEDCEFYHASTGIRLTPTRFSATATT